MPLSQQHLIRRAARCRSLTQTHLLEREGHLMAEYLPIYKPGQAITLKASATITGGRVVAVSGSAPSPRLALTASPGSASPPTTPRPTTT
jgi:hypothetical protein